MTLPVALVKVTLVQVEGVDVARVNAAQRPTLYAMVGTRGLGRRPLATPASATVALHSAADPCEFEFAPSAHAAIPVGVFLWDDRGDAGPASLGSARGTIPAGSASGRYTLPGPQGLRVVVDLDVLPVPGAAPRAAPAPRRPQGAQGGAVVVVTPAAVVTLEDVVGLYKPGAPRPRGLRRPQHQAERLRGYTSEDDRGRIYIERNLAGRWTRETQLIELTARVTMIGQALPPDAKVRWTVFDPDDPGDDARIENVVPGGPVASDAPPNVHPQWASVLDDNDHGPPPAAAGAFRPRVGSRGNDNLGAIPPGPPVFVQVGRFALTRGANAPNPQADTTIRRGRSKVRVKCPSRAGDNLVVRAEVVTASAIVKIPAQTGVMTMWQKINVEYLKMPNALPLPVANVPRHFQSACVQTEFTPPRRVPDVATHAQNDPAFRVAIRAYIERHFSHKNHGGWFCLLASREPYPPVASTTVPALPGVLGARLVPVPALLANGDAPLVDYIDITGDYTHLGSVTVPVPGNARVTFNVDRRATRYDAATNTTRIELDAHDVQNRFEAGDGSLSNAYAHTVHHYLSGRLEDGRWIAGGYGVRPGPITFDGRTRGHYPAGTSPTVPVPGLGDVFGGRTALFTTVYASGGATPAQVDEALEIAIVHELTHAFGMPHKCGHFDYLTPRDKPCCMNYSIQGLLDAATGNLVGRTPFGRGMELCGKHIREVRRTKLSDNPALRWR